MMAGSESGRAAVAGVPCDANWNLRTRLSRTQCQRLGARPGAGARRIGLQKRKSQRRFHGAPPPKCSLRGRDGRSATVLAALHLPEELLGLLTAVEVGLGARFVGDLGPVVA